MNDSDAVETCERWFRYLEEQKEKAAALQRAAALAREGKREEAQQIVRTVDRQPHVFDGATLLPAVKHLVKRLKEANND